MSAIPIPDTSDAGLTAEHLPEEETRKKVIGYLSALGIYVPTEHEIQAQQQLSTDTRPTSTKRLMQAILHPVPRTVTTQDISVLPSFTATPTEDIEQIPGQHGSTYTLKPNHSYSFGRPDPLNRTPPPNLAFSDVSVSRSGGNFSVLPDGRISVTDTGNSNGIDVMLGDQIFRLEKNTPSFLPPGAIVWLGETTAFRVYMSPDGTGKLISLPANERNLLRDLSVAQQKDTTPKMFNDAEVFRRTNQATYAETIAVLLEQKGIPRPLRSISNGQPFDQNTRTAQLLQMVTHPIESAAQTVPQTPEPVAMQATPESTKLEIGAWCVKCTEVSPKHPGFNHDKATVTEHRNKAIDIIMFDGSGGSSDNNALITRTSLELVQAADTALTSGRSPEEAIREVHKLGLTKEPYGTMMIAQITPPDASGKRTVTLTYAGDCVAVRYNPTRTYSSKRSYEATPYKQSETQLAHMQKMNKQHNAAEALKGSPYGPAVTGRIEASGQSAQIYSAVGSSGGNLVVETVTFPLEADESLLVATDGIQVNNLIAENPNTHMPYDSTPAVHRALTLAHTATSAQEMATHLSRIPQLLRTSTEAPEFDDITFAYVMPVQRPA